MSTCVVCNKKLYSLKKELQNIITYLCPENHCSETYQISIGDKEILFRSVRIYDSVYLESLFSFGQIDKIRVYEKTSQYYCNILFELNYQDFGDIDYCDMIALKNKIEICCIFS